MKLFRYLVIFSLLPGLAVAAPKVDLPEWKSGADSDNYYLGGGLWPKGLIADNPENPIAKPDSLLAEGVESTQKTRGPKDAVITEKGIAATSVSNPDAGEGAASKEPVFYGPEQSGNLISPDAIEDTTYVPPQQLQAEAAAAQNGQLSTSNQLQIPGTPEPLPEESIVHQLPPIEGELANEFFAHAPVDFLVDPQRLLTEQKSNDLRRFLEFHADEAEFHIYAFVLGESQKVPSNINLEELHNEWFGENPTVLIVYHQEKPQTTKFVYNEGIQKLLPKSVFDRIAQNVLREGGSTEDGSDQIEKMSLELSIQLYWLARLAERQLELKEKEAAMAAAKGEAAKNEDAPAVESAAVVEALRENDKSSPVVIIESSQGEKRVPFRIVLTILAGTVALMLLVTIGWLALWWWRRDSINGKPMLFPDCEVAHRLGGTYSGGGFVGMSFEVGDN